MRDYRDAKLMASTLRQALREKGCDLSHAECLELVARQLGLKNWNILASRLAGAITAAETISLLLPAGWTKYGRHAEHYAAGIDPSAARDHQRVALIRSRVGEDRLLRDAFATLMQAISAERWRGRRLALEADLSSEDVTGAGAIWMRTDASSGRVLAFDNMEGRSADKVLTGTEAWTRRRVVLDVADNAATVNFGFMLRGRGCIRAAAITLREVGSDIERTDRSAWHQEPENLDFSRAALTST